MGPDNADQVLDNFGKVVIEFAPQHRRLKRDAFQETLDIGVGCGVHEHGRQRRVGPGEFGTELLELVEFLLKIVL